MIGLRKFFNLLTLPALLTTILLPAGRAYADEHEIYARTGMVDAVLGGAKGIEGFMAVPVFDGAFEFMSNSKQSHLIHGTFAQNIATAQTQYYYTGYARRNYILGTVGNRVDVSDQQGSLIIFANKRYYFDWELGIGQVEAQVVNLALNLTSTVFEAGVATGMIWQTGKTFGVNVHLGAGYVYGFSSVAVSGIMIRALVGVSYFL